MNHQIAPLITKSPSRRRLAYDLVVRSEDSRSVFEVIVYALFIACAVVSIAEFAFQPINMPKVTSHTPDTKVAATVLIATANQL